MKASPRIIAGLSLLHPLATLTEARADSQEVVDVATSANVTRAYMNEVVSRLLNFFSPKVQRSARN